MPGSVSFDPVADRYDQTRTYPPEIADRIAAALIEQGHVPLRGSMLEIGVGTGRIALPLLARGAAVTGVDISPLMVDQLRAKYAALRHAQPDRDWGALTIEMADMSALPFPDASFDSTVAVHVFHLVPEWKRALDEALRVTKPGGALLIGQDGHDDSARAEIHDQWEEIIAALGYQPRRVGAQDSAEVRAELAARGLPLDYTTIATWTIADPPRLALRSITEREMSKTWPVPDNLFAESARRLTAWADRTYGDRLDVPQPDTHTFTLAVVRNA
jgi:ubiquinone/menaquinone biosynthesis C-methylase UbiE